LSDYLAEAFNPTQQREELADPTNLFFIAEIDGDAVGYAKVHSGKAPECVTGENPLELSRLYSQQKWIGHGVGAALMRICLDEAKARGCDTLWLGTWEINARGIAFYNKWGFVQVGKQVFMVADEAQTDVVLQRPVAD
jgi:diamine N-acetyltransferase